MSYVDGFVLAVSLAKREAYLTHAQRCAAAFTEAGALSVFECWGDDVPPGKLTSFPLAVQCQPDEAVVFSWVVWPSKEVRDEAWKRLMEDPRMQNDTSPMPFDGKRMIYGGFEVILQA